MIVVAIIGILAAVAIPAFIKYIKASKSSEATSNLRKIYDGEVAYFDIDHVNSAGDRYLAQFVSAGPQPATVPSGQKVLGNWADDGWISLHFGTDAPVYYRYTAVASGTGADASFTARAEGDLDGDGIYSTFERVGRYDSAHGDVSGAAGVFKVNENE
jgi:type IV pilus assembly protein PilA